MRQSSSCHAVSPFQPWHLSSARPVRGSGASQDDLLDLDQQLSSTWLPVRIVQVDEPVALLQSIKSDTSPRGQLVLDQPFVFDL